MDVPELYWLGREGKWFGIRQFAAYMLDGVLQVQSPSRFLTAMILIDDH
jgi:hypothetical protein